MLIPIIKSTLSLLVSPLLSENYHVFQYNSRGVGKSSGWPSFTGFSEVNDLKEVVNWAMQRISDVRSLVIVVGCSLHYSLP
jgi:alpha/beta superfamily hydrolase